MRASLEPDALLRLLDTLNPNHVAGRMTLITRYGHDKIEAHLPKLVRAVKDRGIPSSGRATRCTAMSSRPATATRRARSSVSWPKCAAFAVHRAEGTHGGGIHIEMTGQNVTECTGGAMDVTQMDLADRYHTHCDPRLNAGQSLELAFLLAEMLNQEMGERAKQAA